MSGQAALSAEHKAVLARIARGLRMVTVPFPHLSGLAAAVRVSIDESVPTMGVFASGVHLLMTWSLRFAPAATVAPLQYIEIPFATAIGFVVFGALPNALAAVGIVVTVAAGLYVIHRERRAAERAGQGR